jgi:photosystem II stability/assembly factor-like uncharacterized protein
MINGLAACVEPGADNQHPASPITPPSANQPGDSSDIDVSERHSSGEAEQESEGLPEADQNGHPPLDHDRDPAAPDAMANALDQIRGMHRSDALGTLGAGITPSRWQWLGPSDTGGRVYAIVIHPTNPAIMWVTSPSGGIWKTTNGGAAWQPVNDLLSSLTISSLLIDQQSPNTMYASTGDIFAPGAGIFRSDDGGTTWQQLPATMPTSYQSQWAHVTSLTLAKEGQVLLASIMLRQGDTSGAGIWRSADKGQTWTQVLSNKGALQIVFHPRDSRYALASSYGQAWYSSDGGLTWHDSAGLPTTATAFQNLLDRAELAFAPSDKNVVYASVDANGGQLWKSTNAGQTYTLVNDVAHFHRYGDQAGIWVDPTNANIVVVGGLDAWRSTDGGKTLIKLSDWTDPRSVHADHRVIVGDSQFDGGQDRAVYFGTDGGLYRVDDIYTVQPLQGWQKLNHNLGITQFANMCGSATPYKVAGGTLDNGTLVFDQSTSAWKAVAGGDGDSCAMSPDGGFIYGQVQWMNLWRYAANAQNAVNINGKHEYWNGSQWVCEWQPAPYQIPEAVPATHDCGATDFFAVPVTLDPNNPERLLTAGLSVWRTNNASAPITASDSAPISVPSGPTWSQIKPPMPPRQTWPGEVVYWRAVSAITVAPGDSNIIWVGHNDGRLYKTVNGRSATPDWISADAGLPTSESANGPEYRQVQQILIAPDNPNLVYVVFNGFHADNIWKTTDGGRSWVSIGGSGRDYMLPALPIYSVTAHPKHPQWLYVGTEVGLYSSQDGGQHWFLPQDGPANTRVTKLIWLGESLYAATYGRGIWQAQPGDQASALAHIYLPLLIR